MFLSSFITVCTTEQCSPSRDYRFFGEITTYEFTS